MQYNIYFINYNLNYLFPIISYSAYFSVCVRMCAGACIFHRYIEAYKNATRDKEVGRKVGEFDDLLKTVTQLTGQNMSSVTNLFILYHTLATETSMGLPVPIWSQDMFPDGSLLKAALLQYDLLNYNDQLLRYAAGKDRKKILRRESTGILYMYIC